MSADDVMSQNVPEFNWTPQRDRAAVLVAEDQLTDEQIASSLGIQRRTLTRWKTYDAFIARVQHHRRLWREQIEAEGLVNQQNRINAYNDRWRRMLMVIEERAADAAMQHVAGGKTGLLIHRTRAIGTGRNQTIIDEYEVDTGLLRELRAHEQQAAQELGQWAEKHEHTGAHGQPIQADVQSNVTVEGLHERTARILGVLAEAGVIPPGPDTGDDAENDDLHPTSAD